MPTPTWQGAPASFSASRMSRENSSSATSYPARGVAARRRRISLPLSSNTAISIFVPPRSTPRRSAISGDLVDRRGDLRASELLQPCAEPGLGRRRTREAPARRGLPGTDLHRLAAELVDRAKAVFVGHVVPEKNRRAPGEGLIAHELLDRAALVDPRRLELEHHL